jgi:Fe-S cluster biogenesis protein NfuA
MDAGMQEEVEAVLETIRPSLMADGGNVELVDIDDGVVKLRLVGACSSCSSSTMTLKMGIERALKKAIPMVRCIEAVQ